MQTNTNNDIVLEKADEKPFYTYFQLMPIPEQILEMKIIIKDSEQAKFTAIYSIISKYQTLIMFLIIDKQSTTKKDFENFQYRRINFSEHIKKTK